MTPLETHMTDILGDPMAFAGKNGYVGADMPAELMLAINATHLPFAAGHPTPFADTKLESGFAPWVASILEDWHRGRFDSYERVVFSRGSDDAQRLYYYICELQARGELTGPEPVIFDVSRIRRPSSLKRTAEAIRALMGQFGMSDAALVQAIETLNVRRERFAALQAQRSGNGPLYEQIARASLFADIDAFLGPLPGATCGGRVLLAGTPPPDDRLHRAVEQGGFSIVAEAHEQGLSRLGPKVGAGDPVEALAVQFYNLTLPPRSFADRTRLLLEAVRAERIDAVIIWLIEAEEALVWSVPAQKSALEAAGIPALFLTRRCWDGTDGVDADITAFLKGLSV